jgi:preprotein translocase subunit YajC
MKMIGLIFTFMVQARLWADDAPEAARDQGFTQTIIMIAVAIVFFYFILWRPEQKRRKAMEEQRGAMKKGDKVTAMGIVGTVAQVKDQTVILKMVDGAKIEVLRGAITEVMPGTSEDAAKAD